jgi:hypothetical protein
MLMATWDRMPKNTPAVFDHLVILAGEMRTATYSQVACAIGEDEGREIAPVSLGWPLGFIRDRVCRDRGLPWLNALVVNAGTRLPGDSFLPSEIEFGDDAHVLWRGAVLMVFAYPWETVCIDWDSFEA